MTDNILPYNNAFYGTPLEEWPELPMYMSLDRYATCTCKHCEKTREEFKRELDEALTHCTPIVEEDWEKVKKRLSILSLINGTIYKDTGIKLESKGQMRRKNSNAAWEYFAHWFNEDTMEYRQACRIKV